MVQPGEKIASAKLKEVLRNMGYEVASKNGNLVLFGCDDGSDDFIIDMTVDPIPLDEVVRTLTQTGVDVVNFYQQLDALGS